MLSVTRSALSTEVPVVYRSLAKAAPSIVKRQFNSASPGTPRHPSTHTTSSADVGSSHSDLLAFGIESTTPLRHSPLRTHPTTTPTTTHALPNLTQPRRLHFPISFSTDNLRRQADLPKLRATVRFQYFPECARLVREHLGATRAVPFDWRHTSAKPTWSHASPLQQQQQASSPRTSLRRTLGDEDAAAWMGRRWVVVRVVRPLREGGGSDEVGVALEYDSLDGERAEGVVGDGMMGIAGCEGSIDVRVLALLE